MDMDSKKEEQTYQPQRGRIPQGSAQSTNIVPVGPVSSSDYGHTITPPSVEIPDGTGNCSVVSAIIDNTLNVEIVSEVPDNLTSEAISVNESLEGNLPLDNTLITTTERDIETASVVSESVAMDCDEFRAAKRKFSRSAERHSSEESEDEALKKAKVSRKQRILGEDTISHQSKKQSISNPDLLARPSEEDPRILKMKKGYISKQKKLEIEAAKEDIAEKKREEARKKKEEAIRLKEELRKKEERAKAEAKIMAKISMKSSEEEKDYITNMTASDLAAMALEYLDHVETIRSKCGTMQGALSGELKKRKLSLDNMVRALQAKAEENGDPIFLRSKIEDLIKKNREEEDRRKREISELKETVMSLTKENKEMRKDLKLIRESLEKKDSVEKYLPKKEKNLKDPTTFRVDARRCPSLISVDDGPVMRPPLKGKSTPIPNSNLQQKKKKPEIKIKKPEIKIISNIQVKPPRGEEKIEEIALEGEMTNMEWEENGQGWNEEDVLIEERTQIERNTEERVDIQEEEGTQGKRKKEEESWVTVVKKGKKEKSDDQKKKEKGAASARKSNLTMQKLEIKRKPPKTAAVSIKGDVTKGFSYADVLRKARSHIKMEDLQIDAPKIRKGLNGATIIEISGPECNDKAQRLADKLQEVLKEDNASITTPTIKGDLRLVGLDESISKEEVKWAIEEEGGCNAQDIRIGEIKRSRRGMGIAWVQCPLKAAVEIAKKRKIKVGWTIVGVTLMKARPIQCFRCWHQGHVKNTCRSQIDRSRCCFQCGKEGHGVAACKNAVRCAVCASLGCDSAHRVGSVKCEGVKLRPPINVEPARRTETATAD